MVFYCNLGKYCTTWLEKIRNYSFLSNLLEFVYFLSSHASMSAYEMVAIIAPTATLASCTLRWSLLIIPVPRLIRFRNSFLIFSPKSPPPPKKISLGLSHAVTPSKSALNRLCESLAFHFAEEIQSTSPQEMRFSRDSIILFVFFFFFIFHLSVSVKVCTSNHWNPTSCLSPISTTYSSSPVISSTRIVYVIERI